MLTSVANSALKNKNATTNLFSPWVAPAYTITGL